MRNVVIEHKIDMEDYCEKFNKALGQISKDDVANAIFNLTDVRDALKPKELSRKLDENSDATIGELLDDIMSFLNILEDTFQE